MKNPVTHYTAVLKSLLRVPTYLLTLMYLSVGVFTGMIQSGFDPTIDFGGKIWEIAIAATIIALWYINGTAINDYADIEIDKINLKNDKDRPLVTKLATKKQLIVLALLCGLLAVLLAAYLGPVETAVVSILLILNLIYSIKPINISHRGSFAPLLLPLGYVVLPIVIGYQIYGNGWSALASWVIIAFYLQFIGRIILKDYRDVKGDAAFGKMTFLLSYGNKAVCIVSAVAISLSCIVLLAPLHAYFQYTYFGLICLTAAAVMVLRQLSNTAEWHEQKPLIAAFGRIMTGCTAIMIASLILYIWKTTAFKQLILMLTITAVYIWSAQQAYAFNHSKLSKNKA